MIYPSAAVPSRPRPRSHRARRILAACLTATAPLASAACSTSPDPTASGVAATAAPSATAHPTAADAVAVTGATIVEPVTAGDPANIVFTAVNGTGTPDAITTVTSPISTDITLNNTLSTGSTTDPIALPAHSAVQLSWIGPDVWVFEPTALHAGASIPLTVHFQHAARVTINATVRTAAQMAQTATPAAD
jgi:copper(I)-binding protein